MKDYVKQVIRTEFILTDCVKCSHFCVCSRIMGVMNLAPCEDYTPSAVICPICSGKQIIRQDCDNGYYVEINREQLEMTIWFQDECLAVFSIEHCPACGALLDGGVHHVAG